MLLTEQRFLKNTIKALFINFSFMDHVFGVVAKNPALIPRLLRFSVLFSFCLFACFTFRPMIHFYLIFVKDHLLFRVLR